MSQIVETEHGKVRRLDLLDVLLIFARRKWLILIWALAGLLIAIIALFRATTLYQAVARSCRRQQEQSSAALLSQLGALTAFAGVGSNLGLKNPADLYISILQTNLVAEAMVDRFHLMDVYKIPDREGAAGMLRKRSKFAADKTGLIQITVEDTDPKAGRHTLVNGYADELFEQNNRLAIGAASQRRQFFQQQLADEKDRLADAEIAMKQTQQSTGVLQLSGQAQTIIGQEANIQANITNNEVQLGALLSSSTEQNPDVVRLRTELAGLRQQLQQLQKGENGLMLTQREFPTQNWSTSARSGMCSTIKRSMTCWRGNWRLRGLTRPRHHRRYRSWILRCSPGEVLAEAIPVHADWAGCRNNVRLHPGCRSSICTNMPRQTRG